MGLIASALLLGARDAAAQRPRSAANQGREASDSYRLTMPVLRRVLPVLYAPGADAACKSEGATFRDVAAMTVAEMEAELDRCVPVKRAAVAQGVSTREAALVSKALMEVIRRMAEEESAKVNGGTPRPLPAGVLRDNVALVRQNEAEFSRLARAPQ